MKGFKIMFSQPRIIKASDQLLNFTGNAIKNYPQNFKDQTEFLKVAIDKKQLSYWPLS